MITFSDNDLGLEVEVKNAKLYGTYDTRNSNKTISGTYYIYDTKIRNNRVRVTDSKERVGKPCSMTGWIDVRFISIKEQMPVGDV